MSDFKADVELSEALPIVVNVEIDYNVEGGGIIINKVTALESDPEEYEPEDVPFLPACGSEIELTPFIEHQVIRECEKDFEYRKEY